MAFCISFIFRSFSFSRSNHPPAPFSAQLTTHYCYYLVTFIFIMRMSNLPIVWINVNLDGFILSYPSYFIKFRPVYMHTFNFFYDTYKLLTNTQTYVYSVCQYKNVKRRKTKINKMRYGQHSNQHLSLSHIFESLCCDTSDILFRFCCCCLPVVVCLLRCCCFGIFNGSFECGSTSMLLNKVVVLYKVE